MISQKMLEQFRDKTGEGLVKHIVRYCFSSAYENSTEYDELIGYGMLGVAIALKQHDGKHDFVVFAGYKIKQSILSYLRTSYSKPIYPFLREGFVYADNNNVEAKDSIEYLFKFLNNNERLILRKLYLEEKPYQEVARETGLSKFRIFENRRRAFRKLKEKILC